MTDLASLHGAGYRLVLRQREEERDGEIDADLFGPDGIMNDEAGVIRLTYGDRDGRRALVIDEDAATRIAALLSGPATEGLSPRQIMQTLPVRIYQRVSGSVPPPAPSLLERLGRLGDALLVDLDIGPQPPDMADMPAAFTYLGQFLAHEMTVWHPVGSKEPPVSTFAIDSAIDLKTIFLLPTGFPQSLPPHVEVEEGLPLGRPIADLGKGFPGAGLDDVPRLKSGCPLLFEPRNDQNLAISQTHVAVTRFAQEALRLLDESGISDVAARRIVRRHVQSVVLQDYLRRLVDDCTWTDVMTKGRVWIAPTTSGTPLQHPFHVPPEVSGAIFRFGHAMVRDVYEPWNEVDPENPVSVATASDLLDFSYNGGSLTDGRLTQRWTTDWRQMLGAPGIPAIRARKLGTILSKELFCLPGYLFQPSTSDTSCSVSDPARINLARRTLMGCALLGLPTGQSLARSVNQALEAAGSPRSIPLLPPEELVIPGNRKATEIMEEGQCGERFVDETPLWLYILRESAVLAGGDRLGPLGGRIVAETLNAAIEASGTDMINAGKREPFFPDPCLGPTHPDRYDYADLVRLAFAE